MIFCGIFLSLSFLLTLRAEESYHIAESAPSIASAYDVINETRSEMEASRIPWRTPTFTVVAQNRSITDLLVDFGNQQGIRVHVSPQVRGEISGSFIDQSPPSFLAQISKAYGLSWFYVNGLLYVASNQEVNLIVKPLRYVKADAALAMINTSGFISSDGRVEKIKDSGMVTLSGIPKYIELTQQLLNSMDNETQFHDNGETIIEVFPLNNAWAYDVNVGGPAGATVRGVATTLRQLIWGFGVTVGGGGGNNANGRTANGAHNKMGQPNQMSAPNQTTGVLPPTSQQGPQGAAANAASIAAGNTGETPDGMPPATESPLLPKNPSGGPGSDWTYAMITADVRRNAVVIRDIRANMPLYEAAIRKLDVPVRIIEISAAIVDLELGAARTIGLNKLGINAGTWTSGTNTVTLGGVAQSAPLSPPANLGLSGVFGTAAVTAAINALSAENKAKVLSRPTILTLDNFGAMINNQETFYVNSVGQYVSNLYNVSVGLSLQVVPHVTFQHGETRIYLQVQIQDGKSMPQSTGTLPSVDESLLTTQSVVREDQSLLIGGLYKKINHKDASGYPWLYKVPIVSFLFGVKSSAKEVVERIFVITPRIVEVNSKNLGDYSEYFKPSPTVENAIETEKMGDVLPAFSPLPTSTNAPVTLMSSEPTKNSSSKNTPKKKQNATVTVSSSPPKQQPKNNAPSTSSSKSVSLPESLSLDD
jgi:type III secretion protein C